MNIRCEGCICMKCTHFNEVSDDINACCMDHDSLACLRENQAQACEDFDEV